MHRQASLTFIFITLMLDVIGLGIIIPVLPDLLGQFVGGKVDSTSRIFGLFITTYAAMQFLFSPVLGTLSDQVGRRPILLISLAGSALDYVLMGLAPSLAILFLGRLISGITGANITTAMAYIADVSPPEKKAQNFGMLGMAFGIGFMVGPGIGGLLGKLGPSIPFFAAAGLAGANWLYGYFILPESLPKTLRRPFNWRAANPLGAFRMLRSLPTVGMWLAVCFFLNALAGMVPQTTWVLFTESELGWDELQVGISLAAVGLCSGLAQGLLSRWTLPRLGERRSVILFLCVEVLCYTAYSFVQRGWQMYALLPFFALGALAVSAMEGLISNAVPPNEQGELQGAMGSLTSLGAIIGPLLASNTFAYFSSAQAPLHFPGAAFMLGAVLGLIGLAAALKGLGIKAATVPQS